MQNQHKKNRDFLIEISVFFVLVLITLQLRLQPAHRARLQLHRS